MASRSKKHFGIFTREELSAMTVARRERYFYSQANAFSKLPDEILVVILSKIITRCIYLYQEGCSNILRSTASLRRVCRRFRNLIDELLSNTPLQQIFLIGPISGDFAEMTAIYQEYRNSLWTRLSRTNLDCFASTALVHFQPCLDVSASVNWFPFRDNNLPVQLEDAVAAQRAITSHHAAALALSRIMQQVINRQYWRGRAFTFVLVFHEVDTTWFRVDQYFEKRHRHPDFMPFWDSRGMQLILREWRWIFRRPRKNSPCRVQVILPNVAWATTSNPSSELEVANMCVHDLNQAWVIVHDPADGTPGPTNSRRGQTQRRNLICIPGFSNPVDFPGDSLYAKWLGMSAEDAAKIFCFTVRGLVVGAESDGEIAVLKRIYDARLESTESSDDPDTQAAGAESARRHQAVPLTKPVRREGGKRNGEASN